MAVSSPVELVRLFLEAFNERDVALLEAFSHPELELRPRISAVSGTVYHGKGAPRRYFRELAEAYASFELDVPHIEDLGGGQVLAEVVIRSEGRASGAVIDQPAFHVYRFQDGLMISVESFGDRATALEFATSAEA